MTPAVPSMGSHICGYGYVQKSVYMACEGASKTILIPAQFKTDVEQLSSHNPCSKNVQCKPCPMHLEPSIQLHSSLKDFASETVTGTGTLENRIPK